MLAELPDLWDVNVSDWANDSQTSRFAAGGLSGAVRALRQDRDQQAGGRRRPLHLARHDGFADPARRARFHRRRAPLDRGSLPAQQDRQRRRRRHSRMHRLQCLRDAATTP